MRISPWFSRLGSHWEPSAAGETKMYSTQWHLDKTEQTIELSSSGFNRSRTHTLLSHHFLIKAAEIGSAHRSHVESTSQQGKHTVTEAITSSVPRRSTNDLHHCQRFSSKPRNTLQSNLPYYGNDQSFSLCPRRKRKRKYLVKCLFWVIITEAPLKWPGTAKWGNNGVFNEQEKKDQRKPITCVGLKQWKKEKQQGQLFGCCFCIYKPKHS